MSKKISILFGGIRRDFKKSVQAYFRSLASDKFELDECASDEIMEHAKSKNPHLIFIDAAAEDPAKIVADLRQLDPRMRIVLLTVFEESVYHDFGKESGFDAVIPRQYFEQFIDGFLEEFFPNGS